MIQVLKPFLIIHLFFSFEERQKDSMHQWFTPHMLERNPAGPGQALHGGPPSVWAHHSEAGAGTTTPIQALKDGTQH